MNSELNENNRFSTMLMRPILRISESGWGERAHARRVTPVLVLGLHSPHNEPHLLFRPGRRCTPSMAPTLLLILCPSHNAFAKKKNSSRPRFGRRTSNKNKHDEYISIAPYTPNIIQTDFLNYASCK